MQSFRPLYKSLHRGMAHRYQALWKLHVKIHGVIFPLRAFFIKIKQFVERNFTLSHIKQIKEVRHRLRVISAAAATDHQWIVFCTVFCKQWICPRSKI